MLAESPVPDAAPISEGSAADEAYQKLLVDAGLIREVRRCHGDQQSFERFQPVPITGEPLSRTVIADRR